MRIFSRLPAPDRSWIRQAFCALGIALAALPTPSAAQGLFARRAPRPALVDVLDVGQGDSILIRSPEGKTALVDAGNTKDGAARLLKSMGVSTVDLVVVSHHHSDHFRGMEQIIRLYKPRYFLATNSGHTTKLYLDLLKVVEEEKITAIAPTARPRKIMLGSVEMTILPQPPEDRREENNNSIGLRVQYGSFSILLTGDSEDKQRLWWLQNHPDLLRGCTILKLAHHGSHNGVDANWLQIVRPEAAVVSLGRGNGYGHPHAEAVELLKRNRIPLLRTDQLGTISIESDGSAWKFIQPNLARNRRLTQEDVDRVAVSTDDDAPTSRARSDSSSGRTSSTRRPVRK